MSVKIRLSPAGNKDVNALEHIEALAALDHKPAFVTLHARTATQRYGRAATWEDVEAAARQAGEAFPVLGNGDVLTHFEARRKRAVAPTAAGLMVGRGALSTPGYLMISGTRSRGCRPRRSGSGLLLAGGGLPRHLRRRRARTEDGVVLRALPLQLLPQMASFKRGPLRRLRRPLIQNGRAVDAALEEIEGPRAALLARQLLRSVWKSTSAGLLRAAWRGAEI